MQRVFSAEVLMRRLARIEERDVVLFLIFALGLRLMLMVALPLIDPTEGRYGQIALNVVRDQRWVLPELRIHDELSPFLSKPPLFFWLAALSIEGLGVSAFATRLPSLLSAGFLLWWAYFTLRTVAPRSVARDTVMMTGSSVLFFVVGGATATDMLLALGICGASFSALAWIHAQQNQRPHLRWRVAIVCFLIVGFMTKGPVVLVLFGMPFLGWVLWQREYHLLRKLPWVWGSLLFAALTVPWFYAAEQQSPGFLRYYLLHENFLRFLITNYGDRYGNGHQYPRGTALIMFSISMLPWTPYLMASLWRNARQSLRRLEQDFAMRGHQYPRGTALVMFLIRRLPRIPYLMASLWRNARQPHRRLEQDHAMQRLLLLGFLVPTVFWCLARQILATYLLSAVPMACAWLAWRWHTDSSTKKPPRRKMLLGLALAAVLVYSVAPLSDFYTGQLKTTANLARWLSSLPQRTEETPPPLVFVGPTPHSIWFYASPSVLFKKGESNIHSSRASLAGIEELLRSADETVYVAIRRHDLEALSPLSSCLESIEGGTPRQPTLIDLFAIFEWRAEHCIPPASVAGVRR